MNDFSAEIAFLQELGCSNAEIYEFIVMETVDIIDVQIAMRAKQMQVWDSYWTAVMFGYYV